jgi:Fe-S cluster assembly iron-binding protein IscA
MYLTESAKRVLKQFWHEEREAGEALRIQVSPG